MKKRLKRFAPLQLGIVMAVTYAMLALVLVPFFMIGGMLAPNASGMPMLFLGIGALILPVVYGAMGFVAGVIGAFVYNLAAKWTGGIEVTVEDAPAS